MHFDAKIVTTYQVWYYCTFLWMVIFLEVVNVFSENTVYICNIYVCANKSCFKKMLFVSFLFSVHTV